MPPFVPSGHNQSKQNNKSPSYGLEDDHFAVNDSMLNQERHVNAWVALHNSYGKKIFEDKKHWSSRNKIVEL